LSLNLCQITHLNVGLGPISVTLKGRSHGQLATMVKLWHS